MDDLLRYWFKEEHFIDKRVTDVIKKCRRASVKVYLHSNQEKYRTDYMMNEMGMGDVVDGFFSSAYLGVKKPEAEFWQAVMVKLRPIENREVLMWDDDEANIVSAEKFGLKAELYKGFEGFLKNIENEFPEIDFK